MQVPAQAQAHVGNTEYSCSIRIGIVEEEDEADAVPDDVASPHSREAGLRRRRVRVVGGRSRRARRPLRRLRRRRGRDQRGENRRERERRAALQRR